MPHYIETDVANDLLNAALNRLLTVMASKKFSMLALTVMSIFKVTLLS